MASAQEIKRRIKAVTNTSQITKAMEMVSATKMRRSQEVALRSRPYAMEALRILAYLENRTPYLPELMRPRETKKTALVVVSSDRGLAGSFNANVLRVFERTFAKRIEAEPEAYAIVAIGKKAEEFVARKNYPRATAFRGVGDFAENAETRAIASFLLEGYKEGRWDKATAVATHFRTTLKQEVIVRDLLPITEENIWKTVREIVPEAGRFSGFSEMVSADDAEHGHGDSFEYLVEPGAKEVLDALVPLLFEVMVYDLVIEANASEHSARMVAMKNASENADELKGDLNLEFNKIRQAKITGEIGEIVGGAEALSG